MFCGLRTNVRWQSLDEIPELHLTQGGECLESFPLLLKLKSGTVTPGKLNTTARGPLFTSLDGAVFYTVSEWSYVPFSLTALKEHVTNYPKRAIEAMSVNGKVLELFTHEKNS